MVHQCGSVELAIMGKTADLPVVQKTITVYSNPKFKISKLEYCMKSIKKGF